MESGIIKILDMSAFPSGNPTVEQRKNAALSVAEVVCSITGLSIISTIDQEFGATILLGESGSENSIVYITSINNNTARAINIGRTLYGNDFSNGITTAQNNAYIVNLNVAGSNQYVKYIKTNDACMMGFGPAAAASQANIGVVNIIIDTIVKGAESEKIAGITYNNNVIYQSYSALIENTNGNNAIFSIAAIIPTICPTSQDAIIDIYANNDTEFKCEKMYTNKLNQGPWTVFSDKTGNKYMVVLRNMVSLVVKI